MDTRDGAAGGRAADGSVTGGEANEGAAVNGFHHGDASTCSSNAVVALECDGACGDSGGSSAAADGRAADGSVAGGEAIEGAALNGFHHGDAFVCSTVALEGDGACGDSGRRGGDRAADCNRVGVEPAAPVAIRTRACGAASVLVPIVTALIDAASALLDSTESAVTSVGVPLGHAGVSV